MKNDQTNSGRKLKTIGMVSMSSLVFLLNYHKESDVGSKQNFSIIRLLSCLGFGIQEGAAAAAATALFFD